MEQAVDFAYGNNVLFTIMVIYFLVGLFVAAKTSGAGMKLMSIFVWPVTVWELFKKEIDK